MSDVERGIGTPPAFGIPPNPHALPGGARQSYFETAQKKLPQVNLDNSFCSLPNFLLRRKGDSNPRYSYPYDSLANCWFQPLTHLSKMQNAKCKMRNPQVLSNAAAKVLQKNETTKNNFIFFAFYAILCQKGTKWSRESVPYGLIRTA